MPENINTPTPLPLGSETIVTLNSKLCRSRPGLDTSEKGQITSPAWNRDVFLTTSSLARLPTTLFRLLECIVAFRLYMNLQCSLISPRPDF